MSTREFAALRGQQKYRDADCWRLAYEVSLHNYRMWRLLWFSRRLIRTRVGARPLPQEVRYRLDCRVDEAHDRMIIEAENLQNCAHRIREAEFAGRIFYEEAEERELAGDDQ